MEGSAFHPGAPTSSPLRELGDSGNLKKKKKQKTKQKTEEGIRLCVKSKELVT